MEKRDELLMMFPGNYTWSAAVRSAIGSAIGGGGEIGEIYRVCAALKEKAGDNAGRVPQVGAKSGVGQGLKRRSRFSSDGRQSHITNAE